MSMVVASSWKRTVLTDFLHSFILEVEVVKYVADNMNGTGLLAERNQRLLLPLFYLPAGCFLSLAIWAFVPPRELFATLPGLTMYR